MGKPDSRVAIIGGGITGWCLGLMLGGRGIKSTIYDTDPCSGYASTKNQGWLHTGAFYAALDDQQSAQNCRDGYQWFVNWAQLHAPAAIDVHAASYLLFQKRHKQQYDDTLNRCQSWNLALPSPVLVQNMASQEPILRNSRLEYALAVRDRPVNTKRLIESISREALKRLTQFQPIGGLDSLRISWKHSHWDVDSPGTTPAQYSSVVLACGAYIKTLFSDILPQSPNPFQINKIPVLAIQGQCTRSLLAVPRVRGCPQIVPFSNGAGATVCLHRIDRRAASPSDVTVPQRYDEHRHALQISRWFPGINALVQQGMQANVHLYACQKLEVQGSPSRGPIIRSFEPEPGAGSSLFTLYPGKFTSAPIAASSCASQIAHLPGRLLSNDRSNFTVQSPTIQAQPYAPPATGRYRMVWSGSSLQLQKSP